MEWISVEDRLPEDESWVVVYSDEPYISYYSKEGWLHCNCNCREGSGPEDLERVTHWQPLPSPTKEQTND